MIIKCDTQECGFNCEQSTFCPSNFQTEQGVGQTTELTDFWLEGLAFPDSLSTKWFGAVQSVLVETKLVILEKSFVQLDANHFHGFLVSAVRGIVLAARKDYKQPAGPLQCSWFNVLCNNLLWHKQLLDGSTFHCNRTKCSLQGTICRNVFFVGLLICTGSKIKTICHIKIEIVLYIKWF